MLTEQDIFNKVWAGFVAQGWEISMNEARTMCAYRGKNGTRCAVGILIPDKNYSPNFEGKTIGQIDAPPPEYAPFASFIRELQRVHDCSVEGHLKDDMIIFASQEGLTCPVI